MRKITLKNSFHGTRTVVLTATPDISETWLGIQYEALCAPAPTRAARAKYRRIRRALCGIKGCTCGIVRP